MCYSAQVEAEYKAYVRLFGARLSVKEFYDLFWRRAKETLPIDVPKGLEDAFANPQTDDERAIKALIDEHRVQQAQVYTEELFKQKTRLSTAERKLATKPTKTAAQEARRAAIQIEARHRWLADLRRTSPEPNDSRIFPNSYSPVMVVEDGERVVLPMRYHCLPAGAPPSFDKEYPDTFNARRSSLGGFFWKRTFGYTHGVAIWNSFYENVYRHRLEGRDLGEGERAETARIEFVPSDGNQMLVACLWARWVRPGFPDLLSFAAITDEPPPEVAAAGHDRCIIPLKAENVDSWLHPEREGLAAMQDIMDDRRRPYYEHRLAA